MSRRKVGARAPVTGREEKDVERCALYKNRQTFIFFEDLL
jgi:hypothetical protein